MSDANFYVFCRKTPGKVSAREIMLMNRQNLDSRNNPFECENSYNQN